MPVALATSVQAEIERLHRFFVDWFAAATPDDDATFAAGCADHIADDFVLIEPSGRSIGKQALLEGIRAGRGDNPGFRIAVEDVRIIAAEGSLVVVAYVERQSGARRSTPPENVRHSVATLQRTATGFCWRYVQETWAS